MPFVSYHDTFRSVVAVCDSCGALLHSDGSRSERPFNEMTPDESAPHFDEMRALVRRAEENGWETSGHLVCTTCSRSRAEPGRH